MESRSENAKDYKLMESIRDISTSDENFKLLKCTLCISKENLFECKILLGLMGVPTIHAQSKGEALCAKMALYKSVYAVGYEDMDTLTFRSRLMLKNLGVSASQKLEIIEISHKDVLES